jgi:hypothetical protein
MAISNTTGPLALPVPAPEPGNAADAGRSDAGAAAQTTAGREAQIYADRQATAWRVLLHGGHAKRSSAEGLPKEIIDRILHFVPNDEAHPMASAATSMRMRALTLAPLLEKGMSSRLIIQAKKAGKISNAQKRIEALQDILQIAELTQLSGKNLLEVLNAVTPNIAGPNRRGIGDEVDNDRKRAFLKRIFLTLKQVKKDAIADERHRNQVQEDAPGVNVNAVFADAIADMSMAFCGTTSPQKRQERLRLFITALNKTGNGFKDDGTEFKVDVAVAFAKALADDRLQAYFLPGMAALLGTCESMPDGVAHDRIAASAASVLAKQNLGRENQGELAQCFKRVCEAIGRMGNNEEMTSAFRGAGKAMHWFTEGPQIAVACGSLFEVSERMENENDRKNLYPVMLQAVNSITDSAAKGHGYDALCTLCRKSGDKAFQRDVALGAIRVLRDRVEPETASAICGSVSKIIADLMSESDRLLMSGAMRDLLPSLTNSENIASVCRDLLKIANTAPSMANEEKAALALAIGTALPRLDRHDARAISDRVLRLIASAAHHDPKRPDIIEGVAVIAAGYAAISSDDETLHQAFVLAAGCHIMTSGRESIVAFDAMLKVIDKIGSADALTSALDITCKAIPHVPAGAARTNCCKRLLSVLAWSGMARQGGVDWDSARTRVEYFDSLCKVIGEMDDDQEKISAFKDATIAMPWFAGASHNDVACSSLFNIVAGMKAEESRKNLYPVMLEAVQSLPDEDARIQGYDQLSAFCRHSCPDQGFKHEFVLAACAIFDKLAHRAAAASICGNLSAIVIDSGNEDDKLLVSTAIRGMLPRMYFDAPIASVCLDLCRIASNRPGMPGMPGAEKIAVAVAIGKTVVSLSDPGSIEAVSTAMLHLIASDADQEQAGISDIDLVRAAGVAAASSDDDALRQAFVAAAGKHLDVTNMTNGGPLATFDSMLTVIDMMDDGDALVGAIDIAAKALGRLPTAAARAACCSALLRVVVRIGNEEVGAAAAGAIGAVCNVLGDDAAAQELVDAVAAILAPIKDGPAKEGAVRALGLALCRSPANAASVPRLAAWARIAGSLGNEQLLGPLLVEMGEMLLKSRAQHWSDRIAGSALSVAPLFTPAAVALGLAWQFRPEFRAQGIDILLGLLRQFKSPIDKVSAALGLKRAFSSTAIRSSAVDFRGLLTLDEALEFLIFAEGDNDGANARSNNEQALQSSRYPPLHAFSGFPRIREPVEPGWRERDRHLRAMLSLADESRLAAAERVTPTAGDLRARPGYAHWPTVVGPLAGPGLRALVAVTPSLAAYALRGYGFGFRSHAALSLAVPVVLSAVNAIGVEAARIATEGLEAAELEGLSQFGLDITALEPESSRRRPGIRRPPTSQTLLELLRQARSQTNEEE